MAEIKTLLQKTVKTIREDGVAKVGEKALAYAKRKKLQNIEKTDTDNCFRDVLFINGCDEHLPHPGRYRVSHQREQLESLGWSTGEVYFQNLSVDTVRCYRAFVFFRCPWTESIDLFIREAKRLHKPVLYDVDDLVIDTIYTDQIPFVAAMKPEDKAAYDQNVRNMGRLLKMCDGAITTTEALAEELKHYVPSVWINRNTASEEMAMLSAQAAEVQAKRKKAAIGENTGRIALGYFSGSITHDDDFAMIQPVLSELLAEYPGLELHLVGELSFPEALLPYKKQLIFHPFVSWKKLPELIAGVDINLAPVRDTVFNRAKSENKWVEAALVSVPTVASDVGAFHMQIENQKTGFLCSSPEEWKGTLTRLIEQPALRKKIGKNARRFCLEHCTTSSTGLALKESITSMQPESVGFILPAFQISGGVMVTLQHACILWKAGREVTLFTIDEEGTEKWFEFSGIRFPVINLTRSACPGCLGFATATMWSTVSWLKKLSGAQKTGYLVQNYEPDFYQPGNPLRMEARKTYQCKDSMQYLTISRWCERWLSEEYHNAVRYVANGLECDRFSGNRRILSGQGCLMEDGSWRKIRILIEGDSTAAHKRVDESFAIAAELDPELFEIWYLAYHGEPKKWYRVDRFHKEIPYGEVDQIYRECDILLKSSQLESFSYPPLEMMCSGGYVVAVSNEGNQEYLKDGENALCYRSGRIGEALACIDQLLRNDELQEKLHQNGRNTALSRDWKSLENEIIEIYQ